MKSNGPQILGRYRLEYHFQTDVGRVRSNNEDSLIAEPDLGLFGVCDGLGGHAAGEVASDLASRAMVEILGSGNSAPLDALAQALQLANQRILEEQERTPSRRGMGTTVSLLWMAPRESDEIWVAHIGDSRVYLLHEGRLQQLTEDHSPVFRLHQQGVLSKEQLRNHPQKNLLERSLGICHEIQPDIFSLQLVAGDLILICTDGLTDLLSDAEIEKIMAAGSFPECGPRLVEEANQKGGLDNITLAMVKICSVD